MNRNEVDFNLADLLAPVPRHKVRVRMLTGITYDTTDGNIAPVAVPMKVGEPLIGKCLDMSADTAKSFVDAEMAVYFDTNKIFGKWAHTAGIESVVLKHRHAAGLTLGLKSAGIKFTEAGAAPTGN